jgi:hypothetical protein
MYATFSQKSLIRERVSDEVEILKVDPAVFDRVYSVMPLQ